MTMALRNEMGVNGKMAVRMRNSCGNLCGDLSAVVAQKVIFSTTNLKACAQLQTE